MAPSKLAVATASVNRLVKEEASYHKELQQQQERIKKLESSGDSDDYTLKQERQALGETKKVLPSVQSKIAQALQQLEDQLEANKDAGGEAPTEEVTKAKEAVAEGKKSLREVS